MTDDELQTAIDEAVSMDKAEQKLSALERLRTSVVRERRWLRYLHVLTILLAGSAIVLGVIALIALDRFEDERASRSLGSCLQFNEQQQRAIEGAVEIADTQNHAVLDRIFRDLDPDEEARLQALYVEARADVEAKAVETYPLRDCTPEGIEEYLEAAR